MAEVAVPFAASDAWSVPQLGTIAARGVATDDWVLLDLPGFGASEKRLPGAYPYTRESFSDTLRDLLAEIVAKGDAQAAVIVARLRAAPYAPQLRALFGAGADLQCRQPFIQQGLHRHAGRQGWISSSD